MTISSTTVKNSYNGNGSTLVFTYTFRIFQDSDLEVIIRSSAGTETIKTLNTHYTVEGEGNSSGGTVTFLKSLPDYDYTPLSTDKVIIRRKLPQTQSIDYIANDPFPAESHEEGLDRAMMSLQEMQEELDRAIKLSRTNTITSTEFSQDATARANKVLAFNASGELAVSTEIGTYKGNWTTATAYVVRDIVKDTSNNNIYICLTAHTSTGSQPISSNADSAKWGLIVDAASASSSASAASSSASAASSSASAASTSASNASTSASNASTSASNASSSASAASTSASNASTSASNASSSASAASSSASSASTSATNAANSYDSFDDRYLGAKTSDPTIDNDGDTLLDGALYWNTAVNRMKVYDLGNAAWNFTTPSSSDQSSINTVATNIANVNSVGTSIANVNSVASNSTNINLVAADITNVNNVGSNITGVNSFAERYRVQSSDPSTSLDQGDLVFNTSSLVLKYYDGSAWVSVSGGAGGSGITDITSTDGSVTITTSGTTRDLAVIGGGATNLVAQVRNQTGSTLTKGTVVYISGASGNKALVSKARADVEATSASTFGIVNANISNNSNGYVTVRGILTGLNTSAYADGDTVYLSPTTAGTFTATKPSAPDQLVTIGVITRSHATQGEMEITIQNGYELSELHDVDVTSIANGNVLIYNSTSGVWENKAQSNITAGAVTNGVYLTDAQTLTNKTLTLPVISSISNTGTITLPTSNDTLVGRATTDTLTNKSISLGTNTVTGTTAQFNTALSDGDFATLAGSETLTNKTLTTPTISTISNTGTLTLPTSTDTLVGRATTDTLTNKTLTSPVITTAPSPTFTTAATLNAQGELRLADSDSSNYVGFKSPATVSTNKVWTLPSTDGTSGQAITTDGSATLSFSTFVTPPTTVIETQTFSTAGSATWTKPASGKYAIVRVWGGGGSGGKGVSNGPAGGGGGGGCSEKIILLSSLTSTVTVTVGAGGAAQTSASTPGNAGGSTTFGSYLTATGGGGGGYNAGGGQGGGGGSGGFGSPTAGTGGTTNNANVTSSTAAQVAGGTNANTFSYQTIPLQSLDSLTSPTSLTTQYFVGGVYDNKSDNGSLGGGYSPDTSSIINIGASNTGYGGGGGGSGLDRAGTAADNLGGNSVWGGGGGGGAANSVTGGNAGTSTYGGNGSAGTIDTNASSAGSQPSGGSGGTEGGNSGKGGDGKCVVYVIN